MLVYQIHGLACHEGYGGQIYLLSTSFVLYETLEGLQVFGFDVFHVMHTRARHLPDTTSQKGISADKPGLKMSSRVPAPQGASP